MKAKSNTTSICSYNLKNINNKITININNRNIFIYILVRQSLLRKVGREQQLLDRILINCTLNLALP